MKKLIFPVLSFLFFSVTTAQIAPDKYFVRFSDKNNSPYSIDNPSAYLSKRSIDRRMNQGIPIDETDLPVNPSYLAGVRATGATLLNPSKWLNGVSILVTNPASLEAISALPYVLDVSKKSKSFAQIDDPEYYTEKSFFKHEIYNEPVGSVMKQGYEIGTYDYGMSLNQIQMLNGDVFHQMGYRGQGKVIAVLDAGFLNVNTMDAFDSLWQNNQILGTRDFVDGGEVQFNEHPHGAMVLSCMGCNYPGMMIGTAPLADFWLLRSEDGATEYIIEEYNWVSAAEFADSVGADVINSSLGYTDFNDESQNHSYSDMDGDTAPITIGADMAAKKGILVVNSNGNEGNNPWYYMGAPADGDSVLGIGAVDGSGIYASFSSHGPTYDGRIKPDVSAQGSGVLVSDPYSGGFGYSGGTSFSSPIIAGMAACLWQANPSMTNMQLADAIRKSASQYDSPDEMLGYGIPDFVLANNILTIISNPGENNSLARVYPNPFSSSFTFELAGQEGSNSRIENITIEIMDITGKTVGSQVIKSNNSFETKVEILQKSPAGIYMLKIKSGETQSLLKLVKQD